MTTTTTQKEAKKETLITPTFRVSFPNVFKPKAAVVGQEEKYSIQMLFPKAIKDSAEKARFDAVRAAVSAAAAAKWGPDKAKWPRNLRSPWRDGSEKDYDGYGPDVVFASASSKMKPGLVDENVQPIIEPNAFYGGCYARAEITAFAYEKAGNAGVSFGLRNIQKVRDGEPFSGANAPEDVFDAITPPGGSNKAPAGVGMGLTPINDTDGGLGI